jgi:hypothetical protein
MNLMRTEFQDMDQQPLSEPFFEAVLESESIAVDTIHPPPKKLHQMMA